MDITIQYKIVTTSTNKKPRQLRHFIRGIGLTILLSAALQVSNAANLGSGFSECEGAGCPPAFGSGDYAGSGNNCSTFGTGVIGSDEAYSVFVGGNLSVIDAAELEGVGVVYGDFSMDRVSNGYNVGVAGLGSCVTAPDSETHLFVGGDTSTANGQPIIIGPRSAGFTTGVNVISGDLETGNDPSGATLSLCSGTCNEEPVAGGVVALRQMIDDEFSRLNDISQCIDDFVPATITSDNIYSGTISGPLVVTGGDSTLTLNCEVAQQTGPGGQCAAGIYIFEDPSASRFGNTSTIANIDANAFPTDGSTTLIINSSAAGTVEVRAQFLNAAGNPDAFHATQARYTLWNYPNATQVNFLTFTQHDGSVLIPNGASDFAGSGHNGRFIVRGDVVHRAFGSEFHNFDFIGEVPDSCVTSSTSEPLVIGDRVWIDNNGNGVQDVPNQPAIGDEGDPGFSFALVQLLDDSDNVINETRTDLFGNYRFRTNSEGDLLPPGDYTVQFTLPAGFAFTTPLQNSDTDVDSDAITTVGPTFGQTAQFTIGAGESNLSLDAGLINQNGQCLVANNDIGGNVFRDFNLDGSLGDAEAGFGGVLVQAFSSDNVLIASTTSLPDGSYNLPGLAASGPVRLEFSGLPDFIVPGAAGGDAGSLVQFVQSASCVAHAAVSNPAQFCQVDPQLASAIHNNGDFDSFGGSNGSGASNGALRLFDYNSFGQFAPGLGGPGQFTEPNAPTDFARADEIGTTWGIGYHKPTETLFASAVMKRHSTFGPNGSGAIYQIDATNAAAVPSLFLDLDALGIATSNGTDPHQAGGIPQGANLNTPSLDAVAFDLVGKSSLGDMDLSEDQQTLWVVNLFAKTLLEIPIGESATAPTDSAEITQHTIPEPSCTDGEFRPFGLEIHDGLVYVGGVCSGENGGDQDDLDAFIFTHNPTGPDSAFDQFFTVNVGFDRGCASGGIAQPAIGCDGFLPWISSWNQLSGSDPVEGPSGPNLWSYPQPMFTDIEIDIDGSLILGFADRFGLQAGFLNYDTVNASSRRLVNGVAAGDTMRICNVDGNFVLEGFPGCQQPLGSNGEGNAEPGADGQEYYFQDTSPSPQFDIHQESSLGGLALLNGSGEITTTFTDPLNVWSGGVAWFDALEGTNSNSLLVGNLPPGFERRYQLFEGNQAVTDNFSTRSGKNGGLGDLEVLCDTPPLAIGNYVWFDNNRNGRQDADEAPIPDIELQLLNWIDGNNNGVFELGEQSTPVMFNGAPVIATTNDDGEYYFGYQGGNAAGTVDINLADQFGFVGEQGLDPNAKYAVLIAFNTAPTNTTARNVRLSTAVEASPADATGANDQIDSDGVPSAPGRAPDFVVGGIMTMEAGANDHSLDFGFFQFFDLGDAPDSYGTTLSEDGPRHALDFTNNLLIDNGLGSFSTSTNPEVIVDDELDGVPGVPANGDDIANRDDEDGLDRFLLEVANGNAQFPAVTSAGGSATSTYTLTNLRVFNDADGGRINDGEAYFVGYIDFNRDGDFNDPGEESAVQTIPLIANPPGNSFGEVDTSLVFSGIADIQAGDTYVRLRLTTDPRFATNPSPNGEALDGEIEDHVFRILPVVRLAKQVVPTDSAAVFDLSVTGGAVSPVTAAGVGNGGNTNFVPFDQTVTDNLAFSAVIASNPDSTAFVTSVSCSDADGNILISPVATSGSVAGTGEIFSSTVLNSLSLGSSRNQNTLTCTYTCAQSTRVSIIKQASPADTTAFNFITDLTQDSTDPLGNLLDDDGVVSGTIGEVALNGSDTNASVFDLPIVSGQTQEYTLSENVPTGWRTTAVNCTGAVDSTPDLANSSVDITVGFNNTVVCTFTNVEEVSLGSTIWYDENGNGIQDVGEVGIEGAKVDLLDSAGTAVTPAVTQVTTNANGEYFFNGLLPGDYRVKVTFDGSTVLANLPGDITAVSQLVPTSNQNSTPNDDALLDSNVDIGGPGENAAVQMWVSGVVSLSASTEPENETDNIPGAGSDMPGQSSPDALEDNNGNMTIDLGFIAPVSVGSFVWQDINGDGIQNDGEPGLDGAELSLQINPGSGFVDASDIDGIAQTAIIDSTGRYLFDNLAPGTYKVCINVPTGFVPTVGQVTAIGSVVEGDTNINIAVDSTCGDYESIEETLSPGEEPTEASGEVGDDQDDSSGETGGNMTLDFGFIEPLSIGSFVWNDTNADGIQDDVADEPGIPGVDVDLFFENGDPAMNIAGQLVDTQTTDGSGQYNFTNLLPGKYRVRVTLPDGTDFIPSPAQVSDDDQNQLDSNIDFGVTGLPAGAFESGVIMLVIQTEPEENGLREGDTQDDTSGENNGDMTVDFAFVEPVSVGSLVWNDINGDGEQGSALEEPGVENALVKLFRRIPAFQQPGSAEPGFELEQVTTDLSGTTLGNTSGMPGVFTTGADGQYLFANLAPGTYVIQLMLPADFIPVPIQQSNDDGDSTDSNFDLNADDVPVGSFQSIEFELAAGDEPDNESPLERGDDQDAADDASGEMTIDFGVWVPVSIGSLVWEDTNGDGMQSNNEPPIEGAKLSLLTVDGVNLIAATDVNGDAIADITTDQSGLYRFTNLPAGTYVVQIMPPSGFAPSPIQQGADDNNTEKDSNIDTATTVAANTFQSGRFTIVNLASINETNAFRGDSQDGVLATDRNNISGNMTVDFALVRPLLGSIGNMVWLDEDSDGDQDAGEPGIANVVIILNDETGTEITRATTDNDGKYLFTDLPAGEYFVDVDETTLPDASLIQTATFTNNIDGDDDDVILDDGDFGNKDHADSGYPITLDEGEDNLTADFGYNHNTEEEVNTNVGIAALGDFVWIDSNGDGVQDPEETPVSGVELTLVGAGPDGVFGTADDTSDTTSTNETGFYLFDDLPAGAYMVTVTSSAGANHNVLDDTQFSPTGDPDHFAAASSTVDSTLAGDNKSTEAVILSPGDVFLNVDFGFQPEVLIPPIVGSIGDTIWLDIDADGTGSDISSIDGINNPTAQGDDTGVADPVETGIAGVTVKLIRDTNDDGIIDPDGLDNVAGNDDDESIIATVTTNADGQYLFAGLPVDDGGGDAAYIVMIADTANVLNGHSQTFDADGVAASPNMSAVTLDPTNPDDRAQDFGFTPDEPVGSIGDTVWGDLDDSGGDQSTQGTEPGLAGVSVSLFVDANKDGEPDDTNADGSIDATDAIATQVTDADGFYLFIDLPLDSYLVGVNDSTLPSGYSGDSSRLPDDNTAGEDDALTNLDLGATVMLMADDPHDREQDFSYPLDNTLGQIGDTIWGDTNGDGFGPSGVDGGNNGDLSNDVEPPLEGVTVKLLDDSGVLLATQVTGMDGQFLFVDLNPADTFIVMVDTTTLPDGYLDTPTGDPEGDNNSMSTVDLGDAGTDGVNDPDADNGVNLGQDFGYPPAPVPLGSIGDTVWFDENNSGGDQLTQGAEPGLPNVVVQLFDDGDELISSQLTDENGNYLFQELPLGDYTVVVDPQSLPDYASTTPTHDPDNATLNESEVTLSILQPNNLTQDFSYPPSLVTGAIGDMVFIDNGDIPNQQDPADAPVSNVVVNLLADTDGDNVPDTVIASTETDENGKYLFSGLDPDGIFQVQIDPSVLVNGGPLFGFDNVVDPDGGNDNQSIADLGAVGTDGNADEDSTDNGVNLGQDFGFLPPLANQVAIGNLVWLDVDADGVFEPAGLDGDVSTLDDNETLIGGVTVSLFRDLNDNGLLDTDEPLLGTETTSVGDPVDHGVGPDAPDLGGNYLFTGLPVGSYIVRLTDDDDVLAGFWHSQGTPAINNNSQAQIYPVDVTDGLDDLTADFGFYSEPGAVGNVVWEDINGNGVFDPATEPGIEDVPVTLTIQHPAETVSITVMTEPGGFFEFSNLLLDEDNNGVIDAPDEEPEFVVSVESPEFLQTIFQGATAPADSIIIGGLATDDDDLDVGGDDPEGEPAFPPQGGLDPTNDFGFAPLASIGNFVWLDFDGDGVQDANEDGIANVEVQLTPPAGVDLDGDGPLDPDDPLTTFTGPNGEYLFADLPPVAGYQVSVISGVPTGLIQTFDEGPTPGVTGPLDNTSELIDLSPNEEHLTADFGYAPPVGSIGDTIWIDANNNGIQDPGEPGVFNVTVTLTDSDGTVLETTTDENGNYLFPGLELGRSYLVEVTDDNNVLVDYALMPLGDPDVRDGNSDPGEQDGATFVILTSEDPVNLDADFGYVPNDSVNNSIGDTIWRDADGDGSGPNLASIDGVDNPTVGQGNNVEDDASEQPIPNVTVSLIRDENGNGVFDGGDIVFATTITDGNGQYLFTGLPDDDYIVLVTDQNNVLGGLEPTYDDDGIVMPNQSVVADLGVGLDVPDNRRDQDFGFVDPNTTGGVGSIGDTVFFDSDGSGDPSNADPETREGVEGVTVQLFGPGPDGIIGNGDDILIRSTETDENGNYLFTGLSVADENGPDSGTDYRVVVVTSTLPNGGAGWINSVDPDIIGAVGDSESVTTLTTAVPQDLDQDFGYVSDAMNTLSGTVWSDSNGDGTQTEDGRFSGVTIELRDENGDVIQTTETDDEGNYQFVNLADGIYTVVVTDDANQLNGFEHTDAPAGTETDDETSKDDTGYTVDLDSNGVSDTPVTDVTSDFGYEPTVTNPISLGSFIAEPLGEGVIEIRWATQTEVSNLGFNLYGLVDDEWAQLNEALILSQGDSVAIQRYVERFTSNAEVFAIGDIDLEGKETLNGPFLLGQAYGEIGARRTIDWQSERSEREVKATERERLRKQQQRERNEQRRLRRQQSQSSAAPLPNNTTQERSMNTHSEPWFNRLIAAALSVAIPTAHAADEFAEDVVNLKTTVAGIHEVRYTDLMADEVDITDEPINRIALINKGQAIQIAVTGSDDDPALFGPGSVIRFIAEDVDTLYSGTNVYTLRLDSDAALRVGQDARGIPSGAAATAYLATREYAPQARYSFASPDVNDPWFATRIVASGGQASETMSIELDDMAPGGNNGATKAKLKVNLWGGTDLSGISDDHHVMVAFNGEDVVDGSFDGLAEQEFIVPLDNVRDGRNQVRVLLPLDTGFSFDAVNVNEVAVSYPRQFRAEDNRLDFASSFAKFRIPGFDADTVSSVQDVVVMRQDANGVSVQTESQLVCRSSCTVQFGGTGQLAHYYVSTTDAIYRPTLDALPLEQDITSAPAVYLIISHPDFIGAAGNNQLEALADEMASQMGSAQVVDVEAIYAQFGHHQFTPVAIRDYIQYAVDNLDTQYVTLVGGDVYDYRQFQSEDATSFIPSIYAPTGNNISFAPVDAKYVDLDDDNVPDLPIGRLPVRTVGQLTSLLNKRNTYLARDYMGKILLVADDYDEVQQYNFSADADEIEADFLQGFEVSKAYVDELGVIQARAAVVNGIQQGQSLTAFFGHSSTNQWSFDGLFAGPDAANLSNVDRPTMVTQWGCWNTYYVSPNEDSMGQRFMVEGDQGAVAVMGASTLTNANAERELARLVFARIANGERIGDAVTNAKQVYAQTNPNDLDVLLGWTLLGLPDLTVN